MGIISQKMQVELRFFFFAHCLIVVYIYTKVHGNTLDGIKVIEQTRFSYKKFRRGIIPLKM